MKKQELIKEYEDYLKQGITPELLILDIHMPGGETENIINPNVADKMSYIDRTYDEDLVHRNCKDIFITDAIFVIPGGYGMDFDGAMKAMLEGAKVKLPTWGGYWYWHEQQRTVMMHTKDGKELDIRSTQDVFYTMRNICSDEWILADETNCPQINPAAVPVFSFADAIRFIRAGKKVSRQSWNGKGQYVFLADDVSFTTEAYRSAVAETGVKRIILTAAQAANLFVGSNVEVGDYDGEHTDRSDSHNYSDGRNILITAIEDVTIDNTDYKAVYVDAASTFDTTVNVTMISTLPYYSGWNDTVQGNDGSRYSATSGKEPGLIQKTEFMNGSYIIISDELWKWGKDSNDNYTFDCYTCHDQSKVASSITSDYTKQEDLTLVFPESTSAWWYIEDVAIAEDSSVLWPAKVSTAAGSGTGCKAGFYVGTADDAVRAAWCSFPLMGMLASPRAILTIT